MNFALTIQATLIALLFVSVAVSQEEDVCEDFAGRSGRLCRRFCEVKDCDTTNTSGCGKIRRKFEKLTGEKSLPCEPAVASVWDEFGGRAAFVQNVLRFLNSKALTTQLIMNYQENVSGLHLAAC